MVDSGPDVDRPFRRGLVLDRAGGRWGSPAGRGLALGERRRDRPALDLVRPRAPVVAGARWGGSRRPVVPPAMGHRHADPPRTEGPRPRLARRERPV